MIGRLNGWQRMNKRNRAFFTGIFTPLERPNIYVGDGRNRKHQFLIEGRVKALSFLTGFTRFPILFTFFLLSTFYPLPSSGLPVEDVQLVVDTQYFQVAKKMISEAKSSIQVMMFEMGYYDQHPDTPSNLLIKELIDARKRGVKVEVILEVREGEDRTTNRNRHTGKILSEGRVDVIYDSFSKTTHAKLMVVDGQLSLLGSTNWTYYALTENNEASILVRSKEVARALQDYFNRVKAADSKK
jgi:phosphatidylserine/phosphatidylglycerophosphate/cardiolipin synthase-like enzyme